MHTGDARGGGPPSDPRAHEIAFWRRAPVAAGAGMQYIRGRLLYDIIW